MADLEYIKYTFIDQDEIQAEAGLCCQDDDHMIHDKRFNSLFDYIDSFGQINFIDSDHPPQLEEQNEIIQEMDNNSFKTSEDSDDL